MLTDSEVKIVLGIIGLYYVISAGTGLIFYLKPPKKINGLVGYRTGRSMKNQANWDFAQKIWPGYMLMLSHGQLILSVTLVLLLKNVTGLDAQMLMHTFLFCFSLILTIPLVERKLRRFEESQPSSPA